MRLKVLVTLFSENAMVYRGLSHRSWDISNKNIKKDADSAEI